MKLENLKHKTVLLFGKSRAFSLDEFVAQLGYQNITLATEYSEDVAYVIEGKMMTPYEQNTSDKLYEEKKVEFVSIDIFERELACGMDEETLLMSLKLSHDRTRLKSFLQNSMISDALFLKLLKMYAWSGEDFFENNDNRDVSAAFIVRFYENIERNHNVQYATLGFMHLVSQCKDASVIEAIASLEPLQRSFQSDARDANYSIVTTIATHFLTPSSVLKMLIKKSNSYVKTLIAMRADCNAPMQNILFENGDELVKEALSHNVNLDKDIAKILIQDVLYAKNIAKHIRLDEAIFELLVQKYPTELAHNEYITHEMQNKLFEISDEEVRVALAANVLIDEDIVAKLVQSGSEDINFALYANAKVAPKNLVQAYENNKNYLALSYNPNTPDFILQLLLHTGDIKILEGLAKNPSTPIEILYQLQLDARLERFVKENPSFGKHIVSENIGWIV